MSTDTLRRRILEDSIWRALIAIGWPIAITAQLGTLLGLITTFWVGRLIGGAGLTVLALASPLELALGWLLATIGTGHGALLAVDIGAKGGNASRITFNALLVAAGLAAVTAALGLIALGPIVELLGAEVAGLRAYLTVTLVGLPIVATSFVLSETVLSTGWSRFGLLRGVVDLALMVILAPLFIRGLDLGIAGGALAALAATLLLDCWTAWAIYQRREVLGLGRTLDRSVFTIDRDLWRRLVSVAGPMQLARVSNFIAQLFLVRMVLGDSGADAAGFGLAVLVSAIPGLIGMSLGRAHGVIVGQSVGAGIGARARSSLGAALSLALVVVGVLAVGTLVCEPLVDLFSGDSEITNAAAGALRGLAPGWLAIAAWQVFAATAISLGDTRIAGVVTIAGQWAGVALAYWLDRSMGALTAATTAIVVSNVVNACVVGLVARGLLRRAG